MLVMSNNLPALDDTSSFQCDGGIVSARESEDSVRDKCGDPQEVTQEDADSPIVWIYNSGSSGFLTYVSFANGIVERIQTGGYGD